MKHNYNIRLTGYVGGYDFDADYVQYVLDKTEGPVSVLVSSLGGSVAAALRIASMFGEHGDVSVHYAGMNASAATIASMKAKHVSIDRDALYLVHKCSVDHFAWGDMNADQFAEYLKEIEKQIKDLDTIDNTIAALYASRCKKDKSDLLDLMKVGGWMSADEALEWGFVDEITDYADDVALPSREDAVAVINSAGLPMPECFTVSDESLMRRLVKGLKQFLNSQHMKENDCKLFPNVCAMTEKESYDIAEGNVVIPEADMDKVEANINAMRELADDANARLSEISDAKDKADERISALMSEIETLKAQIEALEAEPADDSANVVENGEPIAEDENEISNFISAHKNAEKMFNILNK